MSANTQEQRNVLLEPEDYNYIDELVLPLTPRASDRPKTLDVPRYQQEAKHPSEQAPFLSPQQRDALIRQARQSWSYVSVQQAPLLSSIQEESPRSSPDVPALSGPQDVLHVKPRPIVYEERGESSRGPQAQPVLDYFIQKASLITAQEIDPSVYYSAEDEDAGYSDEDEDAGYSDENEDPGYSKSKGKEVKRSPSELSFQERFAPARGVPARGRLATHLTPEKPQDDAEDLHSGDSTSPPHRATRLITTGAATDFRDPLSDSLILNLDGDSREFRGREYETVFRNDVPQRRKSIAGYAKSLRKHLIAQLHSARERRASAPAVPSVSEGLAAARPAAALVFPPLPEQSAAADSIAAPMPQNLEQNDHETSGSGTSAVVVHPILIQPHADSSQNTSGQSSQTMLRGGKGSRPSFGKKVGCQTTPPRSPRCILRDQLLRAQERARAAGRLYDDLQGQPLFPPHSLKAEVQLLKNGSSTKRSKQRKAVKKQTPEAQEPRMILRWMWAQKAEVGALRELALEERRQKAQRSSMREPSERAGIPISHIEVHTTQPSDSRDTSIEEEWEEVLSTARTRASNDGRRRNATAYDGPLCSPRPGHACPARSPPANSYCRPSSASPFASPQRTVPHAATLETIWEQSVLDTSVDIADIRNGPEVDTVPHAPTLETIWEQSVLDTSVDIADIRNGPEVDTVNAHTDSNSLQSWYGTDSLIESRAKRTAFSANYFYSGERIVHGFLHRLKRLPAHTLATIIKDWLTKKGIFDHGRVNDADLVDDFMREVGREPAERLANLFAECQ